MKRPVVQSNPLHVAFFPGLEKNVAIYRTRLGDAGNGKKYLYNYPGAITSGSGGGYAMVASEKAIEGAIRIKVKF